MRIAVNHNGAVLRQANGKIIRADSGEELALKMFGIALPVRAFGYWIQGKSRAFFYPPAPMTAATLSKTAGRLTILRGMPKTASKTAHLQNCRSAGKNPH